MSLNGSSSYAHNYSNDYYHHMNNNSEGNLKHKSKYQPRRIFEIEKQAAVCLIIAILLFALVYSIIMKRKMKDMNMNKYSEEKDEALPPIAKPSPSSSISSPLSQSYIPFQPNSQPIPPMLGENSSMPMNNVNSINNMNLGQATLPSNTLAPSPLSMNGLGGNGMETPMIV